MTSIFLSHSSKDREWVHRLATDLRGFGIRVWVDEAELNVGDSLTEKIGYAIHNMDFFGIVLSTHSIGSEWVQRELQIASSRELHEKRVAVLPIMLERVIVPHFLRDKVYADFSEPTNYVKALRKLVRAVSWQSESVHFMVSDTHRDSSGLRTVSNKPSLGEVLRRYSDQRWFHFRPHSLRIITKNAIRHCYVPDGEQLFAIVSLNDGLPSEEGKQVIIFCKSGIYFGDNHGNGEIPYSEFASLDIYSRTKRVRGEWGLVDINQIHFGNLGEITYLGALLLPKPETVVALLKDVQRTLL